MDSDRHFSLFTLGKTEIQEVSHKTRTIWQRKEEAKLFPMSVRVQARANNYIAFGDKVVTEAFLEA